MIYPAGAPVEAVEFFVDYQRVGRLTVPPWRLEVDVGQENRAHRLEAVAYPSGGEPVSAGLETAAIAVHGEVDVRLQQLYVTVTRGGERALDLQRGDFTVRDGGREQEIETFARGDIPFSAAVLVDSSGSMVAGRLETALAGVRVFAERIQPLDQVKLVVFSHRRLRETPFTNLASLLVLGSEGRSASGGTALNDMLFLALKRLEGQKGRRVVLLLSDGVDVNSVVDIDDIARAARRLGALIYWVRLPFQEGAIQSIWRDSQAHKRQRDGLTAAVRASGGREIPVHDAQAVQPAFAEILAELRQQYVFGYQPQPRPPSGRWRQVKVRVRGPGLDVRAPTGYVAP
ncbi:MAG: VWA domain-containing protein [Thermoanaerobaculia bacterium]